MWIGQFEQNMQLSWYTWTSMAVQRLRWNSVRLERVWLPGGVRHGYLSFYFIAVYQNHHRWSHVAFYTVHSLTNHCSSQQYRIIKHCSHTHYEQCSPVTKYPLLRVAEYATVARTRSYSKHFSFPPPSQMLLYHGPIYSSTFLFPSSFKKTQNQCARTGNLLVYMCGGATPVAWKFSATPVAKIYTTKVVATEAEQRTKQHR
jgi:hypothetical protein